MAHAADYAVPTTVRAHAVREICRRRVFAAAVPEAAGGFPQPAPFGWALLRELLEAAVAERDLRALRAVTDAIELLGAARQVREARATLDRALQDADPATEVAGEDDGPPR
jgi:hypothetical protein